MGPIGLTLGLSVTHLTQDSSRPGAFVELGFIDLGQYVSFEGGGKLREPRPDDILSPWLTAGLAWGTQNPFFIAVTAGVSPTFRVSDGNDDASDDEVAGSFNLGLTTGVHVPLLDLN